MATSKSSLALLKLSDLSFEKAIDFMPFDDYFELGLASAKAKTKMCAWKKRQLFEFRIRKMEPDAFGKMPFYMKCFLQEKEEVGGKVHVFKFHNGPWPEKSSLSYRKPVNLGGKKVEISTASVNQHGACYEIRVPDLDECGAYVLALLTFIGELFEINQMSFEMELDDIHKSPQLFAHPAFQNCDDVYINKPERRFHCRKATDQEEEALCRTMNTIGTVKSLHLLANCTQKLSCPRIFEVVRYEAEQTEFITGDNLLNMTCQQALLSLTHLTASELNAFFRHWKAGGNKTISQLTLSCYEQFASAVVLDGLNAIPVDRTRPAPRVVAHLTYGRLSPLVLEEEFSTYMEIVREDGVVGYLLINRDESGLTFYVIDSRIQDFEKITKYEAKVQRLRQPNFIL